MQKPRESWNLFICSFIPGFIIWPNILYVCTCVDLQKCWACLLLRPCWQAAGKAISDVCFQLQKKTFFIWGDVVVFFLSWFKGGNMFPSRDVGLPPSPSRAKNDAETFWHTWFIIFLIFLHFSLPVEIFLGDLAWNYLSNWAGFSPSPGDTGLWFNISLKLWCVFS